MRLLILATGKNSRDLGHDNRDQDMLEHETLKYQRIISSWVSIEMESG